MSKYRVRVVVVKEIVRNVSAKTAAQAIRKVKEMARIKHKIALKDFEQWPEADKF